MTHSELSRKREEDCSRGSDGQRHGGGGVNSAQEMAALSVHEVDDPSITLVLL